MLNVLATMKSLKIITGLASKGETKRLQTGCKIMNEAFICLTVTSFPLSHYSYHHKLKGFFPLEKKRQY